ncbi:type II toxin-antitoxin system RelE/ParE family toxin [Sphingomonas suaedae]|uniref:Type II toxin-antitoxin system RelE/ParE family toxin n=1 Tax=Sphingomonas suaedae TaxID=2599297 RepID=A0A518RD18_9SPHN|nr:type II toxin-antitoxin system RelE/ParE family toxin [Sphingomonas suaedae]QDX25368.1 type II toxin-antitoxin system RelE/ParE family toxin [Sphingomonas suaedae]
MRLVFAPAAQADLREIAAYIAEDDPDHARSFVAELRKACVILIDHPFLGMARPEVGDGLRSKPHGRYAIFYRVIEDVVRIERVIHTSRDKQRL